MGDAIPDPPRTLAGALDPDASLLALARRASAEPDVREPRELKTPVISVGGLTMGGAGKSPMVAHLARVLREAGRNPAILTRGYRRESSDVVIVPRGGSAAPSATGDEAQIFLRRGDAHVGIGSGPVRSGRRMETELAPDVFLLDDGFQHVASRGSTISC